MAPRYGRGSETSSCRPERSEDRAFRIRAGKPKSRSFAMLRMTTQKRLTKNLPQAFAGAHCCRAAGGELLVRAEHRILQSSRAAQVRFRREIVVHIHDAAVGQRQHYLNVAQLLGGNLLVVAVDGHEIGKL